MEEIDLKELFNILWHKKISVILIILICIMTGLIYTIGFTTPMYSSSTTLVLATSNNQELSRESLITSATATELTVNSKLVSTYSELVKSKNVLRQVISNLGIKVDENELRKNVKVKSVKDTELIEITVKNKNATHSAKIANEIANVFTYKVKEIYNIENVQIVDEAEISNIPSNINHKRDVLIFTIIGFAISILYILFINILDTTVKGPEDIENTIKLPVLVSIPFYETDIQKKKGGVK